MEQKNAKLICSVPVLSPILIYWKLRLKQTIVQLFLSRVMRYIYSLNVGKGILCVIDFFRAELEYVSIMIV